MDPETTGSTQGKGKGNSQNLSEGQSQAKLCRSGEPQCKYEQKDKSHLTFPIKEKLNDQFT